MNRRLSISGILFLTMFAVACSKNSTSHTNSASDQATPTNVNKATATQEDANDPAVATLNSGIPDKLTMPAVTKGKDLTADDIQNVRAFFLTLSPQNKMEIPNSALIFPDRSTPELSAQADEDLKALQSRDQDAYSMVMAMRGNCKVPHVTSDINATVPTKAPVQFDTLERNDHGKATISTAMNDGCLISGSTGANIEASVTDVDHDKKSLALKGGLGAKLSLKVNDEKYAQKIGARGMSINYGISGLAATHEINIQDHTGKLLARYKVGGTFNSLKGDIPFDMDVTALIKSKKVGESQTELIAKITMNVPGVTQAELVAHMTQKNVGDVSTTDSEQYFLNGTEKTKAQLEDIFGNKTQTLMNISASAADNLQ